MSKLFKKSLALAVMSSVLFLAPAGGQERSAAANLAQKETARSMMCDAMVEVAPVRTTDAQRREVFAELDRILTFGGGVESTCVSGDGSETCVCDDSCIASPNDCICMTIEDEEDEE